MENQSDTTQHNAAPAVTRPKLGTLHFKIPGKPKADIPATPDTVPQEAPSSPWVGDIPKNQDQLPVAQGKDSAAPSSPKTATAEVLPYDLHDRLRLVRNPAGKAYAVVQHAGNPVALSIGSRGLNAIITTCAAQKGKSLRPRQIDEVNQQLEAHAEQYGKTQDVWYRVAKIEGGIELDLGDENHTRARITAGSVEIPVVGSDVVFQRTPNIQPMVMPAAEGDVDLLRKYLNVGAPEQLMLIAWITYTLAHPKVPSSKYVFLVLNGNEGSGKSSLSRLLLRLIDPSALGVQTFPRNEKDLAIAGQSAQVLAFDNLRAFKWGMADLLCIASTGGMTTSRRLYTDDVQQATPLHVALILNGIHPFIGQPDLAQRCLPISLRPIDPSKRKTEEALMAELEADMPKIMRGLFDLIAKVFEQLPHAEATNPERMIEFSQWLAVMERVDGVPAGINPYQRLYSEILQQGQLDTLMDNPLAAAIIEFAEALEENAWSGTPADFLARLNICTSHGSGFSRDWPQNAIALSKRIGPLQAGLLSQGIRIELSRGKERVVTLTKEDS